MLCTLSLLVLVPQVGAGPQDTGPKVFYPSPPDPPRVQFLCSISKARDVEGKPPGQGVFLPGKEPPDKRQISRPFGCAAHGGFFYVTDTRFAAILKLDLKGKRVDVISPKGRGVVKKPMSISFAANGTAYVADAGRQQILVYDKDFNYQTEFGFDDEKSMPVDVKVWRDRLYVVDRGAACVRVLYLESGKEVMVLGRKPTVEEELTAPTSLAVDKNGYVYVVDTVRGRVYVWDKNGKFVRHIGGPGFVVGQFARPKGIAVSGNTLYVLDAAFENCQIFDLNGNALMYFGGPGTGPGNLYLPATVWVGESGLEAFKDRLDPDFKAEKLIMITSQFGPRKVSFFALGKSDKFKYIETKLPEKPSRAEFSGPEEMSGKGKKGTKGTKGTKTETGRKGDNDKKVGRTGKQQGKQAGK